MEKTQEHKAQVAQQEAGTIIDGPRSEGQASEMEHLNEHEAKQYERFLGGFRDASRRWNAAQRDKILRELAAAMEAGQEVDAAWVKHKTIMDFLDPVAHMSQPSTKAALAAVQTLLEENRPALESAAILNGMETEIRAVVQRMTPKARATMGVLLCLSGLEGLSLNVQFGKKLVNELEDRDAIETAILEAGDEPDAEVIQKAYDLAIAIENAEDR